MDRKTSRHRCNWLRRVSCALIVALANSASAQEATGPRVASPQPVLPLGVPVPAVGPSPSGDAVAAGCPMCQQAACRGCAPCIAGVDCLDGRGGEARWKDMRPMDFQPYLQGEYAGPPRLAHLNEYRLRPSDELQVLYLITRRQTAGAYRLSVGDEVMIESIGDEDLRRGTLENGLQIQPDGTITVKLLGQVHAAGLTVDQLRDLLESRYTQYLDDPAIDVTPVKTNTLAEDIRNAVGGASGLQQQAVNVRVTPDGSIRLPAIGEVYVQGLSLEEVKHEINLRYAEIVVGLEVEPVLTQQAPHFVYVLGEVAAPSRFQIDTPTTVIGAIALAGGYNPTGNLRQIVIFRRAEDWRLLATMVDLRGALDGRRPSPADEIWLRDGDIVVVPKTPIRHFNHFVDQVFTQGIYGIFPFTAGIDVRNGSF